jgi:hypothetical protein
MARFLPPDPSLDHLKNEAKALRKAHQSKDPAVCATLRRLHRFENATDEQILAAKLSLAEAQFALAMDYGFAGWAELRKTVLSLQPAADYRPEPQRDALLLPNPKPGTRDVNRFAAAFWMALSHLGIPADPAQVAGDSGLAFILQADSLEHPWGADRKELDIGYWPRDYWGAMLRLDFLGRACGVPMRALGCAGAEFRADSAAHYRKRYHSEVLRSLQAGRPLIAVAGGDDPHVVYGCDSGNPPLLGQWPCDPELNVDRMKEYPWEVIVLDEPGAPMDRRQADAEALEFGLRLGRDEVDLSNRPGKLSGRRAWELWLSQLEDPKLCGPHYYHNNVIIHLRQNRRAAAAYLHAMSQRYSGRAAEALASAAAGFDAVLEKLNQADTSRDTYNTDAGRQSLISVLRETMALDASCHERMVEALEFIR